MGYGVEQGFPQRLDGIFIQSDAIETNYAHRMAGVRVNGQRQFFPSANR
jgi:hypothetical protein